MNFTVTKLSGSAPHSAFTDLCARNGELFCCFREATNHVSPDGRIKILRLNADGELLSAAIVQLPFCDLRDPKLTVNPNGVLCLLIWKKQFQPNGQYLYGKAVSMFSSDGQSWSSGREIGHKNWWLWRVRWHQKRHATSLQMTNTAYGFAYNRGANAIHLYCGDTQKYMSTHVNDALSLAKHGLGYPNESDMVFIGDEAWAIIRRDADTYSAQLGYSKWPFKQWQWHDLGMYLGGPCILAKDQSGIWVSARIWENNQLTTRLLELDLRSKQLNSLAELPSAGDNSYPGMAQVDNHLFVSYYSQHQDRKCQIYLAKFAL